MTGIQQIHILCGHCTTRFPSPIMFSDSTTLENSTLIGNRVQCPKCGQMIHCNTENMSLTYVDNSHEVFPDFGSNKGGGKP